MSLQAQEMFKILQEVDKLLGDIELKITRITGETKTGASSNIENSLSSIKKLESVALRYLALARKIGIPEDAERVINLGAEMLVLIRMMQMSMVAMAGGPLGIAMGAAGMIMTGLSAGSLMEGY